MSPASRTDEVVDLVQQMIRNRCVNDGSPQSGEETRNADLLEDLLAGSGVDVERYESGPGRANLVARLEGSDPAAPTLCLMGHTDVVPVNEDRWSRDPFGGELVDGVVWGRGAIDMFSLTASMGVVVRDLARSGFRPRGTLVYAAVADEEALGRFGAEHLVTEHADAVRCDYLLTESGGFPFPSGEGTALPYLTEEKGPMWSSVHVHGTPTHGSMPYGADNALVKGAEVVRRLAEYRPPPRLDESWQAFVNGLAFPPELAAPLLEAEGFHDALALLPPGIARMAYSCTHMTIAPTMLQAGSKVNIIPETVEIQLDVRTLPDQGPVEVEHAIRDAISELADDVEIRVGAPDLATVSPADSPLADALGRAARAFYDDARLVPMRMVGTTDARHFRRHFDTVAYGFGMFSRRLSIEDLATMGHGDDERIDVESLAMVTDLWDVLVRDFLG
jgi:acetylornithine deacetylase/succinyl-diaminopimelate desuccinylase-like protein